LNENQEIVFEHKELGDHFLRYFFLAIVRGLLRLEFDKTTLSLLKPGKPFIYLNFRLTLETHLVHNALESFTPALS